MKLYRSVEHDGEQQMTPSAMRRRRANATAGACDKPIPALSSSSTANATATDPGAPPVNDNESGNESGCNSNGIDCQNSTPRSSLEPVGDITASDDISANTNTNTVYTLDSPDLTAQRGRSISAKLQLLAHMRNRNDVSSHTSLSQCTSSVGSDTEGLSSDEMESGDDDEEEDEGDDVIITAKERARAKSRLSWDSSASRKSSRGEDMHLTSPMRVLMQMQEQKQRDHQGQNNGDCHKGLNQQQQQHRRQKRFMDKKLKAARKLLGSIRLAPQKTKKSAFRQQSESVQHDDETAPNFDIDSLQSAYDSGDGAISTEEDVNIGQSQPQPQPQLAQNQKTSKISVHAKYGSYADFDQLRRRNRKSSDLSMIIKSNQRRSDAQQTTLLSDEYLTPLARSPSDHRIKMSIEDIGRRLTMISPRGKASTAIISAMSGNTTDEDAQNDDTLLERDIAPADDVDRVKDPESTPPPPPSDLEPSNDSSAIPERQRNATILRRIISSSSSISSAKDISPTSNLPSDEGIGAETVNKNKRSKSRRQSLKLLLNNIRKNSGVAKDPLAFYEAVKANDLKRVRSMIHPDASSPITSRRRKSINMHALLDGGEKVLQSLFCTIDLDWKNTNDQDMSALHICAMHGHTQMLALLLEYGARPNTEDKFQRTPLHLCSSGGHHACAILLCSQGALVNARDHYGFSPLYLAIRHHHFDVALDLLVFGADINFKTLGGTTILHDVMKRNDVKAAQFLVSKADHHFCLVNAKDEKGDPPLFKAVQEGHTEVIEAMMGLNKLTPGKPRFTITARNSAGCNVFHVAATAGHACMIRYLVEMASSLGCSLNQLSILLNEKDKRFGYTPLHWAVRENEFDAVKELLFLASAPDEEINIDVCRKTGKTAAASSGGGNSNAFVSLLSKVLGGAAAGGGGGGSGGNSAVMSQPANVLNIDVNAQDDQLNTPTHLAIKRHKKQTDVISLLLSYTRVRLDIKNKEGETIKSLCKKYGISYSSRSKEGFSRLMMDSSDSESD